MSPDRYLRIFDILNLLVGKRDGLRLTEIKDGLGLPASSVHNALQTMVSADVLTVDESLRYYLGPRTVALALRAVQSLDLRGLAKRPLQELAKRIGDDCYLAMRMGRRVFYADRITGTQRISLDIRLGEPLYLHSTATGKLFAALDDKLAAQVLAGKLVRLTSSTITDSKALLKEFQAIRDAGYSKSLEESSEGVVGYAVPIFDQPHSIAAAVHVSVLASRATKAHERKLLTYAFECAHQIQRSLGNFDDSSKPLGDEASVKAPAA